MKILTNLSRTVFFTFLCALSFNAFSSPAPQISNNQAFQHPQTSITVVGAEITLPSKGIWSIKTEDNTALTDISLIVPELIQQRGIGERELKRQERSKRSKGRYLLDTIYYQLEKFAKENAGVTPQSIDDIKDDKRLKGKDLANVFLIPSIKIVNKEGKRWRRVKEKHPLLVELNPLVDDGKYWVKYANGRTDLVDIDQDLVKKYGLTIKAQQKSLEQRFTEIEVSANYQIIARLKNTLPKSSQNIGLENIETGEKLEIKWRPEIKQQDSGLIKTWAIQRLKNWNHMLDNGEDGYLPYWLDAGYRQYGLERKDVVVERRNSRRMRGNRSTNLFNVLGGRAAIQETLQLQQLNAERTDSEEQSIPIDSIKGVEVKSHPFTKMLAGKKGGSLALADIVPTDRFFAWFANPKDLNQYLDGGSEFIFNAGSSISGKNNDKQLKEYYFNKLGVDSKWAKHFLGSGAVSELAVVLPDLFLLDGTDVTLIMKLQQPTVAKTLLALLGIDAQNKIATHSHSRGKSYWSLHDDLLLVSTHANELERVRALAAGDKQNSLGQSAEFKYMLTQLPIEKKSHSFFYFSDPFIRNLVGPKVKIAQLRRLQARAEMESATAARLLYKVDGNNKTPSLELLVEKKYLHDPILVKDMKFAVDGSVSSLEWGSPANMPTLLNSPISNIRPSEKKAYELYLRNYNRFWRRFFDPIAIRLNQESEHQMEVSTFILPLIDNSIYQQLRQMVVSDKNAKKLSIPRLKPEPIAQLSLNLNKELWEKGANEFIQKFLVKLVGIPPRIGDYFGPDVHLALGDGDPIIVMGSGGLTDAFGMFNGAGRRGLSLMLPFAGSLLTRPTVLMIGLTDPEAVKGMLHGLSYGPIRSTSTRRSFGEGSFYGIAGKDAWRYELNIEGIIGMRFGIEVKDRYLVISNQPNSYNPELTRADIALNNGAALSLSPRAAVKQRPALFASASAQQRKAAMSGINVLYPFMVSGTNSIEAASKQVKAQLGYLPIHPGNGKWQWKSGRLSSTVFGDSTRQYQSEYNDNEAFGVLQKVKNVRMNMQFEDDGLRAQVRWEMIH